MYGEYATVAMELPRGVIQDLCPLVGKGKGREKGKGMGARQYIHPQYLLAYGISIKWARPYIRYIANL